ncbi:MAG: ParB N-terminal domain-containing protein [Erysipelotrichaceae bacterium]
MQTQLVKIKDLKNNTGQIDGLPKNPRILKDDKFIKLKKSLEDDPEMLELREVIAYDNNGELIVICGNMRLKALKELGIKEVPTKILPTETSVEKLKAYTIKDNVYFGDHDWEVLANEWDNEELEEWGLELPGFDIDADELGEEFSLPDGDKAPFQQMTFTLADEQAEQIKNAIADIKSTEEYKYCETLGNENSNGNALYLIIMQWAEQKK